MVKGDIKVVSSIFRTFGVNRRDFLRGNRRVDLRAGWRASLCEGACQEGVKGAVARQNENDNEREN